MGNSHSILTQEDILSDKIAFPGANVDMAVSNAGVDPAIVRRESAVQGWAASLQSGQPREILTSAAGGGSVSFGTTGMQVNAGITSGDTAQALSLHLARSDTLDLLKFVGIIRVHYPTPFTDDYEVGLCQDGVNNDTGAYLDFTTGEYHAGVSTSAATLPAQDEVSVLIIKIDFAAGETRFEQRGAVNETATIATTSPPWDGKVLANSNGGGEYVSLQFMEELNIGSK